MMRQPEFNSSLFGDDFLWGVAIAAVQNEGAWNTDGKGLSIWDTFSKSSGKTKDAARPTHANNFYHRYKDDLLLTKALGFNVFRFSISWARIIPEGTGRVNKEGLLFYHRLIAECHKNGLTPFVTLYHWDLPAALEKEGGWTSHFMLKWFTRFVTVCANEFGDSVKNWIILNEPFGFTSLGYMLGKHAPGKKGLSNFLPAIHHAALAQAEGGRVIRKLVPNAYIGTTFSCAEVVPWSGSIEDRQAADRIDVLMNRLFIEPAMGLRFPQGDFPFLERIHLYNKTWKFTERYAFDFDFIGVQNYFTITVKYNRFIPIVKASEVKARSRNVPCTDMGWEINAGSFYRMLKRFAAYSPKTDIIVTESGAMFRDVIENGEVRDLARIEYFDQYLRALHLAKQDGVNLKGYFAWTLTDNFEWAEGYRARFGLIYVDFETQLRTIKQSGYWFKDFLQPARQV